MTAPQSISSRFAYRFDGPELEASRLRARSFSALIFSDFGHPPTSGILAGCVGMRETVVTLEGLRGLILDLTSALALKGIQPGMTVTLLRFPRTSELLVAAAYLALSAWGVRVFYPMHLEREGLPEWLAQTQAVALLGAFDELESDLTLPEDKTWSRTVREAAREAGIPALCLNRDLDLTNRILRGKPFESRPQKEFETWQERFDYADLSTPCTILTTSGTTRRSRLVEYTQGAFLRSCAAWEQAGFFRKEALGGRALCTLLGHSLGMRALWNAVWVRQPLIFISPEWFLEHPSRIPGLLLRMRPEHVSGGPAVFAGLLEFAKYFPPLTTRLFRHMRCMVSTSAGFDPRVAERVQETFGIRLDNAFALTETHQVASTKFGGAAPSIGAPLPGVSLGLETHERLPAGTCALWVRSPFAASGYLGEETPAQDGWWPTGDLATIRSGEIVTLGREVRDFFKDYFGAKISRTRLAEMYGDLAPEADAMEFFPLENELGLTAVVFIPDEDVRTSDDEIRKRFVERLTFLNKDVEDFEKRHLSVQRVLVVRGKAPRTRKGEVARDKVFAEGAIPTGVKVSRGREAGELTSMELARIFAIRFALALGWAGGAGNSRG